MLDGPEPTRAALRPPPSGGLILRGALRGAAGALAGYAIALAAYVAIDLRSESHPDLLKLPAAIPGLFAGLALTLRRRVPPWHRALAAVGPAVCLGIALWITFVIWVGYQFGLGPWQFPVFAGVVFGTAGTLSALCVAPAMRLRSARAVAGFVFAGAGAFLAGGLAYGALIYYAASRVGPNAEPWMLAVPAGQALVLASGWGALGATAQHLPSGEPSGPVA